MHKGPEKTLKLTFYGTLMLLFVSGVVFFFLGTLHLAPSYLRDLKALSLVVHGSATPVFIFLFGGIVFTHVVSTWRSVAYRPSGLLLLVSLGILTLTVPVLYYAGSELIRKVAVFAHVAFGFLVPGAVWWHITARKRLTMEIEENSSIIPFRLKMRYK